MERQYWIKAVGFAKNQLPYEWKERHRLTEAVMFKKKPGSVRKGDRIVYYAAGTGLIFAEGEVTSFAYHAPHRLPDLPDFPWFVDVRLDIAPPNIKNGAPLQAVSVGDRSVSALMRRRSHMRLSEQEYLAAVDALGADSESADG